MSTDVKFDSTGKIVLSHIYDQSDPRAYFSTLEHLDYTIPQRAKPMFCGVIEALRTARDIERCKVIDVGCSYGVGGAMIKFDLDMDDLFSLYADPAAQELTREALLARDRMAFASPADPDLSVVGVDQAANAVAYAVAAGSLDDGVAADFEVAPADDESLAKLAGADLIISTGCYGYVSQASLSRIMQPSLERRPWMAHFVLRMFSFDVVKDALAAHGYTTERIAGYFPQRRFASRQERDNAMANLAGLGIKPCRQELEGWYVAELYVSRPSSEARAMPAEDLLGGLVRGGAARDAA